MEELTWYLPQEESTNPRPVIIGLSGFAHKSERTRIDNLLEKLSHQGMMGVRVNYPGIIEKEEGKTIECRFNLSMYVQAAQEAREVASKRNDTDTNRIGILDSSIGSCISGYWLAQYPDWNPACKVSISPLAGWKYYGKEEARRVIEQERRDITIPLTNQDRKQGISRRYIPKEYLDEVIRTDAITALQISNRALALPMLTIVGTQDEEVSQDSMESYHFILADSHNGEWRALASAHAIPEKRYELCVIRFFKKHLLK